MGKLIRASIMIIGVLVLSGCAGERYALITKDGILYMHIKSERECQQIMKKFNVDGICVIE